MLFRIPPQLKKEMIALRDSAFDRGVWDFADPTGKIEDGEMVVDVIRCLIRPGKNMVTLDSGVPVTYSHQSAQNLETVILLETPKSYLSEGDVLVKAAELQVNANRIEKLNPEIYEWKIFGIRALGTRMLLDINERGLP